MSIYPNVHRRVTAILFTISLLGLSVLPVSTIRAESNELLSPEGFVLIDGQPRLIIGSYELPSEDERLIRLAQSGFNLVRVPDVAALDRIRPHGLYGWICISPSLPEGDDARRAKLAETIQAAKDHPALLAWELPDEALWNVWYGRQPWAFWEQHKAICNEIKNAANLAADQRESLLAQANRAHNLMRRGLWPEGEAIRDTIYRELGKTDPHPERRFSQAASDANALAEAMARGCAVIRQTDPKHVLWQNHAPRNTLAALGRFNEMVDVAGCDIYPAPVGSNGHSDLKDITLASVGGYTERMRAAAPGKANWMVLQGFGWRDIQEGAKSPDPNHGRRPTAHESRFMAYDAIVHGANGILYWGTHAIEKDCPLWSDLLHLAAELRALEPAIVAQRPAVAPVARADENYGSIDPEDGPCLMLRQSGDDWVLIAVNERGQGLPFNVTGLEALEGRTLHLLGTDEEHPIKGGQLHDGIASYGVHVYATSRRFEVKTP
jgi:hypothetical protein